MERKDELEAQVRKTSLRERLDECRTRIGKMCSEGRPPRMCIPVQWDDDDFYISTTLADAQRALDAERARVKELQGAASTPINELLAELISCAGVFDVSTDYEADEVDLEKATRAVLDYVQALRDECERLRKALEVAGDDICSEFCGAGPCHKKCLAVKAALASQDAGKEPSHG